MLHSIETRLSASTGCLNSRAKASASGRATLSATPPGGSGTTIMIGLSDAVGADIGPNATI